METNEITIIEQDDKIEIVTNDNDEAENLISFLEESRT